MHLLYIENTNMSGYINSMFTIIILAFIGFSFGDICKPLKAWYEDRERGWFWGEWCDRKDENKEDKKEKKKVVRVPWDKLEEMNWREIQKLVEEVRGQAVMNPTYENVREWKRLVLWMTRKGMEFMKMDRMVTLTSGDVYVVNRGSPYYNRARIKRKEEKINEVLRRFKGRAGLVVFVDPACGYCKLYEPIVLSFKEETGWDVMFVNVRERPGAATRLGVGAVPDTFLVLRKGRDYVWQRVGTGAFTLDVLKESVVIALSVMKEVDYEEVFGEPGVGMHLVGR